MLGSGYRKDHSKLIISESLACTSDFKIPRSGVITCYPDNSIHSTVINVGQGGCGLTTQVWFLQADAYTGLMGDGSFEVETCQWAEP